MTPSPRPLGQGFGRDTPLVEDRESVAHHAASGEPTADRLHNRESPSPSEMAEMLREVQDSLAALDGRVAALEGGRGESSLVTRRLALNVAELGETLAKRVRSLEMDIGGTPSPALNPMPAASPFAAALVSRPDRSPRRPVNGLALILGAAVLFGLILIGLWVFGRWREGDAPAARPLVSVAAPAPVSLPPPATTAAATPPPAVHRAAPPAAHRPRHYNLYPARHTVAARPTPAIPVADGPAPTGYGSFAPAAVTNTPPGPPR